MDTGFRDLSLSWGFTSDFTIIILSFVYRIYFAELLNIQVGFNLDLTLKRHREIQWACQLTLF